METRSIKSEVRSEGNKLVGYAITFDQEATIRESGRTFREVVRAGSINLQPDVIATFNHDANRLLGRTSSGTLKLFEDKHGVRFEVDLPDTQTGQEVRALVQRGDLAGASFTFAVKSEEWIDGVRNLTAVDVYELGPVTLPAYDSTSIGLRQKLSTVKRRLAVREKQW